MLIIDRNNILIQITMQVIIQRNQSESKLIIYNQTSLRLKRSTAGNYESNDFYHKY
jgi:hypothetical protein